MPCWGIADVSVRYGLRDRRLYRTLLDSSEQLDKQVHASARRGVWRWLAAIKQGGRCTVAPASHSTTATSNWMDGGPGLPQRGHLAREYFMFMSSVYSF